MQPASKSEAAHANYANPTTGDRITCHGGWDGGGWGEDSGEELDDEEEGVLVNVDPQGEEGDIDNRLLGLDGLQVGPQVDHLQAMLALLWRGLSLFE